jgi:hypothetical protein
VNPVGGQSLRSGGDDAVVLHTGVEALGILVLAFALGAGAGLDAINALEGADRLGRADRLAITARGAELTDDLKGHRDFSSKILNRKDTKGAKGAKDAKDAKDAKKD